MRKSALRNAWGRCASYHVSMCCSVTIICIICIIIKIILLCIMDCTFEHKNVACRFYVDMKNVVWRDVRFRRGYPVAVSGTLSSSLSSSTRTIVILGTILWTRICAANHAEPGRWATCKVRRRRRVAARKAGTKGHRPPGLAIGCWGARRGCYGNQLHRRRRRQRWRRRRQRRITWPWPVVTSAGNGLPRPATTIPIIMQMSSNNNTGRSSTAATAAATTTTATTSPSAVPRKRRTPQYSPTRWPARRVCTRTPETNRTTSWWWTAAVPGARPPPPTRLSRSSNTEKSNWIRPNYKQSPMVSTNDLLWYNI